MASSTDLNRRRLMLLAGALGAVPLLGTDAARAQSSTAKAQPDTRLADRIAAGFIGDATVRREGLTLDLPALGDNPAAVPVRVHVTEEITEALWCDEIILIAELNPMPLASRFTFGPITGTADVSVRLRLMETMHLRALARMSDGQVLEARGHITVAAGACGL